MYQLLWDRDSIIDLSKTEGFQLFCDLILLPPYPKDMFTLIKTAQSAGALEYVVASL